MNDEQRIYATGGGTKWPALRWNALLGLAALLLVGLGLPAVSVQAAGITVNSTADVIADDGQCTLREAITAANNDTASGPTLGECTTGGGADVITLPADTYTLALAVSDLFNQNIGFDLDVRSEMTINGAGPGTTIVQAGTDATNGIDRVFEVVNGGKLTINAITVRYGRPGSFGGGLRVGSGELMVNHSIISDNGATFGGAIDLATVTRLTVFNSTIANNTATGDGGGVNASSGNTVLIQNSTLAYNTSGNEGGAFKQQSGATTFTNSTLVGNTATRGGGIFVAFDTVTLQNSIITGSSGGDCAFFLGTVAGSGNLIDGTSCGAGAGRLTAVTNLDSTLRDNSGPTPTFALLAESNAIDAGEDSLCPTTDQRGVTRPQGACDIGAYEFLPDSTPPLITPNVTGTPGNNGWYVSDVMVSWTVTDPESAVTMTSGCQDQSVTADTTGTTFTCTATSAGGTDTESVAIKRDATAPSLAPSVSPNPVTLNGSATASPNSSDGLSGIATSGCDPVDTTSVGPKTVSCTATDQAGNSANALANYTVTATPLLQTAVLIATVEGLPVPPAVKRVLKVPLLVAKAALQNNRPQVACGSLRVFEGIVRQLRQANKLTAAQATQLTGASQSIRTTLGCR